ncbi:MAG TPA: TonB-dependent receptor [Allosphingosinicella sp.]|jgi:outer membrane receptor protein involved in Fe transport
MTKKNILTDLLATTVFCGALGIAAPAYAQNQTQDAQPQSATPPTTAPSADAQASDQGTIVITGSRIPQPNLTAVSPVTVVNSQEVTLSGATRAEDIINSLPQAVASQSGNISNGSTGTATINLRNLGSQRTLVLVNGRRLVPGDPTSSAADINAIPATLIQRVDVLTGGASSVYGADAVAGVVNFIMDTNFEGIRLDGQYSFFEHDNGTNSGLIPALNARGFGFPTGPVADGGTIDLSGQIGASFDDGHGHVVAYGTYRRLNAVTQNKRDYSACTAQAQRTLTDPTFICGGSATSANGTVIAFQGGTSTLFQIGPNRTLPGGFTPFNFAPTNYYQRPDERYTLGFFANYEISPAFHPYMEGMFMDDRTVAQIAPSGDFGNTFAVNCDNPLLGAAQKAIICAPENLLTTPDLFGVFPGTVTKPDATDCATRGAVACATPHVFIDPTTGLPYFKGFAQLLRRNVEGGPRIDDREHQEFRIVAGMKGDIGKTWSYDAYYLYGRTNFSDTYTNDFSITRLRNALDVVTNPANGQPVCRSVLAGTDTACVPYDVWGGTISQAAINYLETPGFQRAVNGETVVSGSITGKLGDYGIQFPWAENGVGIALGAEYRKESLDLRTDAAFSLLPSSDLAGQGAPTLSTSGAFDVREVFGELRVPIVENGFLQNLSLEGSYRHSSYEIKGTNNRFSTNTYKIGADLAPVRDIRFRGAYNRAVRAPNIQELFAPVHVQLDGVTDPCSSNTPSASLAACQAQGVTAAQFGHIAGNPAGQYNGQVGGVPTLRPEVADTYTLGAVIQPRFIPRLAITVDWYNIKIKNAIQQIGADTILATCDDTLDPGICGLIHRDASGSLWRSAAGFVIDQPRNIGSFSTRGIDVGVSYAMNLGHMGGLNFNMQGTWLDQIVVNTGISTPFNCAGLYGPICSGGNVLSGPNPKWRHKARLTWNAPDGIGLSFQWRYFGAVHEEGTSSQPGLSGPVSIRNAKIPSQSYFDLALTTKIGDHYQFRLGVNNILDKEPPIFGSNGSAPGINACPGIYCNGNTFPGFYDALGRYIFAGVTLDF